MSQTIVTSNGVRRPYVKVLLAVAGSEDPLASRLTDDDGATAWDELQPQPNTPYTLIVDEPGYQRFVQQYPTVYTDIEIPLQSIASTLSPLVRIDRHRFVTADNQRVFLRMCSDFVLFWRYLEGEDITPVLRQRRAIGFNCVRVFGMCHYIMLNDLHAPDFRPQNYPDYHERQLDFFHLCAAHGLYVYFCEFPDNAFIMPDEDAQDFYHEGNANQMRQVGGIMEGTNEYDAHSWNWIDFDRIKKPVGVLWCASSQGEELHDYYADFYDFHPGRGYPKHIKDQNLADNPNFEVGREGGLGENDRFGDGGNPDIKKAFEMAGSSQGTALFTSYHSQQGKEGRVFTGNTLDGALAFMDGLVA